jgi:pimeloyl-ACP methyl ester carboxylesterase
VNPYFEKYTGLSKHDTLFLHGNLASTKWWQPTLQEWRKAGSLGEGHLIFSDWRGCGQNPNWPMENKFTIRELAEDQLQLLETIGVEQVDIVGHSLGGLIAMQMMILAPKRIRKAVLLDSVGLKGVIFDESMYEAFQQMAASSELTRLVILSTVAHSEKLAPAFADAIAADAFKAVKGIGSSVLEILKSVNLEQEARAIQTPILLLHGKNDQIIPLSDSENAAKILPTAKLEVLPEAGHCWNIENPKAFTARLREWL